MKLKNEIIQFAKSRLLKVEEFTDATWRRFANRMQFSQPQQIMAYIGYGNDTQVWVLGRVLANKPIRSPGKEDNWWDNLRATYERWETDEVAGASVKLLYGSQQRVVETDEEGYYQAPFTRDVDCSRTDIVVARARSTNGTIVAQHKITTPRWMQLLKITPMVVSQYCVGRIPQFRVKHKLLEQRHLPYCSTCSISLPSNSYVEEV